MDGRRKKHEVRPHKSLDKRKRDGSSLIDADQLGLAEFVRVVRLDVLHRLSVSLPKHIDSHNCLVKVWIARLHQFVVSVFLVPKRVKPLRGGHSSLVRRCNTRS